MSDLDEIRQKRMAEICDPARDHVAGHLLVHKPGLFFRTGPADRHDGGSAV